MTPSPPSSEASSPSSVYSSSSNKSIDLPFINSVTGSLSGSEAPKYCVASHSVRITKYGYAIDPVELRYKEILSSISDASRRSSGASFDSSHIAHKVLKLIRGFWSQPAFPKGSIAARKDKNASLDEIISEFNQFPKYPHKMTFGSLAVEKVYPSSSKIRISSKKGKISPSLADKSPGSERSNKNGTVSPSVESTSQSSSIALPLVPQVKPSSPKSSKKKMPSSPDSTSLLSLFSPKRRQRSVSTSHHVATQYHTWIPDNKNQVFELVSELCRAMEKVFSSEARIIDVPSPCIVLGDIHGNLTDLRTYERSLWPKAPVSLTSNYLFLGDYVDRGEYSVECVMYLFAMKLISPDRFFLLRGNHEVAAIQKQYTFGRECETKFGVQGRHLWKSFNRVFDLMPIAAILDGQIFCCHGGIPRSVTEVRKLARDIPSPLDNPEVQSPAAWEILWNDPITDSELIGMIELDNAIVTQTQTTQTQPAPDGNSLITTTTASTTLATVENEENPNVSQSERNTETKGTASMLASTIAGTESAIFNLQKDRALQEANSILNREPPGTTSFYIKPTNDSPSDVPLNSTQSTDGQQNSEENSGLRSIPSDTSSIASTSPQQMLSDGFVSNIKRGTAFLFSDQAIDHFLKVNKLSHVIRAHEVIPTGFAFHGNGRVITIFSSSKYCGLNNQSACCLVDRQRIRILRLDTGDLGE